MATDKEQAILIDVATQEPVGTPLALGGRPTVVKAFDAFPNTLFVALEKKSIVGSTHVLKVIFTTYEIQADAHTDRITDIEYSSIGGKHFFFTGSLDGTVKVWSPSDDGQSLT